VPELWRQRSVRDAIQVRQQGARKVLELFGFRRIHAVIRRPFYGGEQRSSVSSAAWPGLKSFEI